MLNSYKKIDNPDAIEVIEIDRKTLPPGDYQSIGYESRQVIDIKMTRLVTEYRAEILEDKLGNQFVAEFPQGVTRPAQYGQNLKAQSVYMSQQQLLPYDRIQDYFSDQAGIPVSTGSIVNFNREAFALLSELKFDESVRKNLISSKLLHADETGINVNGKRIWLHCTSSSLWTLFFPHDRRGFEAITAMGVLPYFHGILCHDHWKAYFQLSCQHALCNAHHLRELEQAFEQEGQRWAKKMQKLLIEINAAVQKAGGVLGEKKAKGYFKRYRTIIANAERECLPPDKNARKPKRGRTKKSKSRNLLERMRDFETETLRFMVNKEVPFTNNQGENDIRMTKVQQKISGCFRSMDGANIFCLVRSYLSSCRKQGIQPTDALRMLFSGKLPKFTKNE